MQKNLLQSHKFRDFFCKKNNKSCDNYYSCRDFLIFFRIEADWVLDYIPLADRRWSRSCEVSPAVRWGRGQGSAVVELPVAAW